MTQTRRDLACRIDHTLLRPDASEREIDSLCEEAARYGFAAVCVNSLWTARCSANLSGSPVAVCAVVGFPFGATRTEIKAAETALALTDGADEIDMVINIGALKSGKWGTVARDIDEVVSLVKAKEAVSKVILETALLSDAEIVQASKLVETAGADFVKTSTGFAGTPTPPEAVALIRANVDATTGVKASGGVRTARDVDAMLAAGATRVGTSAGVKIVTGQASLNPASY